MKVRLIEQWKFIKNSRVEEKQLKVGEQFHGNQYVEVWSPIGDHTKITFLQLENP
jgi:hypothetical protein